MASIVTTNENIIVDRDYTDNFSVKETAVNELAPKYFGDEALSQLNIGALGFTMEQIANITEDAFNTMSVLIHEAFPNKAIIPESIFSHAAIFQIDNAFASCAKCSFVMLLSQEEILNLGETKGLVTSLYIDKNTVFTVTGANQEIPFTLDYDILIQAQKKQISGSDFEYNFSAKYVLDSKNAVSEVNDPYLKIRKLPNGTLLLQFLAHQVERTIIEDTIITNSKINFPVKDYTFSDSLAGFDVFYRAPGKKEWVQLQTRLKFSLPVKDPFCYYRLKDETTLEITFSSRDGYFQPEFNSDLKIVMYTTIGTKGQFPSYDGNHIDIMPCVDTWEYNQDLTMAVKTVSDSSGASERMSLEALQALTVENYSSASEISSENDLYNYFMNFKYRYGNEIRVIKRRDDVTERLYSAFLLMKNGDYIYPTNTASIVLGYDDYDTNDNDERYVLRPGHVFVYDGNNNQLKMVPDVWAYDEEEVANLLSVHKFVYANPFMIAMNRNPNLAGLYQTVCDQTYPLDYMTANEDSFMQFITSKVRIHRELEKDSSYKMEVSLIPSTSMDQYVKNLNTNEGNFVRIIAGLCNASGEEVGYIELFPTDINPDDVTNVTFTGILETDDVVSSRGYFTVLNGKNASGNSVDIPIKDTLINLYVMYDDAIPKVNRFTGIFDNMEFFSITNVYSNRSNPSTFIEPMNMMRTTVSFRNAGTAEAPRVISSLSLVPVIKADIVNDKDNFSYFINRLSANYTYITECSSLLRNNTNIDVKFYNTYGRSINYTIGDDGELIDRVNLTIKFQVTLKDGADELTARKNISGFIKQFIERVNVENGANNLYISNLIRELENTVKAVHYLKFLGINDYDTSYQTISIKEPDLNKLTKEERRNYVPEILVANPEDIRLSIFVN